jgi:AraC family transcriptional regulator of adaptative response/methylated-DNA-[protein]-cysteine methyltransferase
MKAVVTEKSQLAAGTLHDPRWAAVVARSADADGQFFYSVRTTGVYCRPSCASRRARPENVAFHATRADAERAGFRPCKRCRPDQPTLREQHAAVITDICRLIESAESVPDLAALAAPCRVEPVSFPSSLQGDYRRDAAAIRRHNTACRECAENCAAARA